MQYDVVSEVGEFSQVSGRYRVDWIPIPVYDISPAAYVASTERVTRKTITHVQIKGNRLVTNDSHLWRIFDLDAKTRTTIDARKKSYVVESIEVAKDPRTTLFRTWPHATGQASRFNGEDARRFDVPVTAQWHTEWRVQESIVFWIADHSVSPELGLFRKKWEAVTSLPFPDGSDRKFGDLATVVKMADPQVVRIITEFPPIDKLLAAQDSLSGARVRFKVAAGRIPTFTSSGLFPNEFFPLFQSGCGSR